MQYITVDGNNIKNRFDFELEIKRTFTKDIAWINYSQCESFNLDGINDFLHGGFGVFDYNKSIELIWLHADKSKENLGKEETIEYLNYQLTHCHETAIDSINKRLTELVENN